jgi:dedicator of cytokinesis protein 1
MMTDQLKYHLERQEELEACCQLLSNILEVLYRKDVVSHDVMPWTASPAID